MRSAQRRAPSESESGWAKQVAVGVPKELHIRLIWGDLPAQEREKQGPGALS